MAEGVGTDDDLLAHHALHGEAAGVHPRAYVFHDRQGRGGGRDVAGGPSRSSGWWVGLEEDDAQGRQREGERMRSAVPGREVGFHAPEVAHAAAAVERRVAVQELAPGAAVGHADAIALADRPA
jgi:hypothetical protein